LVLSGGVYLPPLLMRHVPAASPNGGSRLTPRQLEVLRGITEGKSNKEIATALHLSLYTVETHRRNLQEKLNLHSFPELVLYAVRKGIIA